LSQLHQIRQTGRFY